VLAGVFLREGRREGLREEGRGEGGREGGRDVHTLVSSIHRFTEG